MRAWLAAVCAVAACGGGGGASTGDDDPTDAAVDAPGDGPVTPAWTTLVERTWQINPGVEDSKCVGMKIEADTYINGLRLRSTAGITFAMLTIATSDDQTPNGTYDCNSGKVDKELLFAGGIGTDDVVFPADVAIKLPAGSSINLNLQLVNPSTTDYTNGKSGIDVLTIPAAEVKHEADMMFLGTRELHIPPTNQPYDGVVGSCTIPETWTVVGLWPHMKRYATRQAVTLRRAGTQTDTMVLDAPFSLQEQKNYPMQIALHPNDRLTVRCTYVNNTNTLYPPGFEVIYSESSNAGAEACFTGFYKWPADNLEKYFCAP